MPNLKHRKVIDLLKEAIKDIPTSNHKTKNTRFPIPKLPEGELTVTDKWTSLLWNIKTAEAHGKKALEGLTIALARIIQADILENILFDVRIGSRANDSIETLLWDTKKPIRADGASINSLLRKRRRIAPIELAHTPVIPQPWERWRLARSLQNLGQGAAWGTWKQSYNIYATAWTPWPIVWVDNGNHSTMAAILTHGGELKASESFDAKELLLSVYTDGENWLRVDNDQVIAPVTSLPMAAIFEIGRRLIKAPKIEIK
jgi:hypothetical protein